MYNGSPALVVVAMRRPYAVATHGMSATLMISAIARIPAAATHAKELPCIAGSLFDVARSCQKTSSDDISAVAISNRSDPCVPTHGTRNRLNASAPTIAPTVFDAYV